jgi:protein TonB
MAIAALGALLLYGGAVYLTMAAHVALEVTPPVHTELPVVQALPPPPPPPAPQPKEEAAPVQPRRVRRVAPPPPAEASQVITRSSDEPVDLSSFSIATGHAAVFAGGYTAANGTSHSAVSAPNAGRALPRASRSGSPSLAREAQPARRDWSCAWPDDAQQTDLRETRVTVKVAVSADGDPSAVEVQGGALAGFAEAARRCALSEQYRPALDAGGRRIAGDTPLLSVHFVR